MTRKKLGDGWQLAGNAMQTLIHISPRAFGKVCTTDAHTEEGITCKGDILFLAIEEA